MGKQCMHSQTCPIFATSWTVARQAPLSMGFSRQECWSGFPLPLPGDLHAPGIEPMSPVAPALASGFFATEPLGSNTEPQMFSLQVKLSLPPGSATYSCVT